MIDYCLINILNHWYLHLSPSHENLGCFQPWHQSNNQINYLKQCMLTFLLDLRIFEKKGVVLSRAKYFSPLFHKDFLTEIHICTYSIQKSNLTKSQIKILNHEMIGYYKSLKFICLLSVKYIDPYCLDRIVLGFYRICTFLVRSYNTPEPK